MRNQEACPDCGKHIMDTSKYCTCGWQKVSSAAAPTTDHRCQFQSNGRRCPLPATVCEALYGAGRAWYCFDHVRCRNDPEKGQAIILDAEKNYQAILKKRRDWRWDLESRK